MRPKPLSSVVSSNLQVSLNFDPPNHIPWISVIHADSLLVPPISVIPIIHTGLYDPS